MTPSEYAAQRRERYRTDPEYRAAKLAANTAYQRAHPERARAASARWRERRDGPRRSIADRFWAKVEKGDRCWEWTGARNAAGYGKLRANSRYWAAPRFVVEIICGDAIPDGMQVCHRCDNPPCVRPDHLFLGTNEDNVRDRIAKGRAGSPGPRNASRGEGRWSAKLTAAQVAELRAAYAAGGVTQRELAARYGVQQGQISRIIGGTRWAGR